MESENNQFIYTVLVTCRGAVNSTVGTVMSLTDLQRHMKCVIIDELHEKNLNLDVQFFKKTVSQTITNIFRQQWHG